MKKVLATVAVSTALVMGGAAAAFAAPIEVDGGIRIRGISTDTGITDNSASTNKYDQKVFVGFKSKPSDNLTGYIRLMTGTTSDNFDWDDGASNKTGTEMRLDEAWIDYKATKNVGIKAGRQHINLGGNNFWDHRGDAPDSVISLYGDFAGTKLQAMTVKLQENTAADNSDDLDAYILTLDRKFSDNFSGGLNYTYLKGASETDSNAVAAKTTTDTGGDTVTLTPAVANTLLNGMALSNLGANAAFKAGGLTVKGDVNFQFGNFSDNGVTEMDADGYAVQLNAEYKLGKSKFGGMFALGSGDDNANDNDHSQFMPYLFSTYRHNTLAGYALPTPGNKTLGLGGNTGLSNLTIYQLNAGTDITCPITGKPLSLFTALNYLQTTEDVADGNGAMTNDLGTEVHAKAAWKLTSNLTYAVEGFYLWTDDAYSNGKGTTNIDDVYWLRHGITMKF